MAIARPHPDILVFDPPHQSIKYFRAVHRSLIVLGIVLLIAIAIGTTIEATLCFELLLRYEIYPASSKLLLVVILSLCGMTVAIANSSLIYILLNLFKPILVQSCTFDRSLGELSIQQYNLFDRQLRIIKIPLNQIVDIQVRHYPGSLVDGYFNISLMTRLSSKPLYIYQKIYVRRVLSASTIQSLLNEVEIMRDFLSLSSESTYNTFIRLKWYEVLSVGLPIDYNRIRSIEQTNDTFVCDFRKRFRLGEIWMIDCFSASIKIECCTLISNHVKYINKSEIKTIDVKTEFLPLEAASHRLSYFLHKKQYQKQYSAILIYSDRAKTTAKNSYRRIFTSTDLSLVMDIADRIRVNLDLPLDQPQSNHAIELDTAGAVK